MDFGVLGRLSVSRDGEAIELTSAKQRTLLAVLLAGANRPVPPDRLADAAWGEAPPSPATLRWHVHHLRQALGGDRVTREPGGYLLIVRDGELDAARFEELCARAAGSGPAEVARLLSEAMGLWRGPAYADLPGDALTEEVARLEELRLLAAEQRAEAMLALDRADELTADLAALVAAHPLRERLRELLMRALRLAGRRADALRVHQEGRDVLVAELGIEPGRRLRELHEEILREEDPVPAVRPAQLPPDVYAFTGRAAELDAMDGDAPLVVISGAGGVGKTGLAVHWAHRAAHRYPDGQLYVDLRGQADPLDPADVLERFSHALGVTRPPSGLDERSALFRSLVRDRRMLILLDNASGAAQVRPLLPGTARCRVVVTGRRRFDGLVAGEGAKPVQLDVLPQGEAAALVARIASREPSAERPLSRVAELCDGLPLALRIAGARLATRPGWTAEDLAGRLEEERRRLDELRAGDLDVRAGFELGYRHLPAPERTLFERLGLLDLPGGFAPWIVAALMDVQVEQAGDLLERLADAQLVQPLGADPSGQERYRFHDLIRLFARERATAAMDAPARAAVLGRAFETFLALADEAYSRDYLDGFIPFHGDAPRRRAEPEAVARMLGDPLAWLEAERRTLTGLVARAAELGMTTHCWDLALSGVRLYEISGYLDDWRATTLLALRACRTKSDRRGENAMLVSLGALETIERRYDQARPLLTEALPGLSGHTRILALVNLASVERRTGRAAESLALYDEALALVRESGDAPALALTLCFLSGAYEDLGRYEAAEDLLAGVPALGIGRVEIEVAIRLAKIALRRGDHARAYELFSAVVDKAGGWRDRVNVAMGKEGVGKALAGLGRRREAVEVLTEAIRLSAAVGENARALEIRNFLDALAGDRARG
ncbi:BTAD domain-containing putative transcriptional regulator [Nonomuraea mangrovi]|uniref:BTAD domain-containing putative transcriptional regulator n=1 Tax=Nonomuraea mangrovi TaxID=2316207 RepID=A0ABW4TCF4_9ACTN